MSREIFSCRNRILLGAGFVPLLLNFPALGNPTGGTATQGSATFSSSGNTFTINQTSANAFITWSTFNIGLGETVNFNQPTVESVAFNQINDANPSQILGNLNANGYVILENANGFYVGGQASITAHGLIMTTATPTINFSDGGPWSFNAPPPTAKIKNCGQINITGGGTAYLIAADIVNNGTITAPNGQIGLYDGETVLVSTSPNGQGLSAAVTLPQGSVDNEGKLTANGGSVVAQAQFVNQNGVVQANTAQNVGGTIELLGGSSVTLGANSTISATGDSTAASASAGGSVQIQAGTTFSDASGSSINVSGASQGGNAGQISVSAPQMSALNSTLNGQAAAGYLNGTLSIDTVDIALNSDGSPIANALALDVNALSSGFSQINLQASDDITLDTPWTLAVNGGIPSSVLLQAGNEIALGSSSEIEADGGNITLKAPTVDQAGTLQADSVGGANGVIEIDASQDLILEGSSTINAVGDSTATTTASPGGFVVLNAENIYSDAAGSTISVSGNAAGGQGGIVEIFDPQVGSTPIQSTISGAFAYLVNPFDMTLSANLTDTSSSPSYNPNFNISDLSVYSQIDLQALDNIDISTLWSLNLNYPVAVGSLSLTAGNNINLGSATATDQEGISAGQNWAVNLTAGTGFVPTISQPTPTSDSDGIYLYGDACLQTANGNINLWAANEVQVGWSGTAGILGSVNPGIGSITTAAGGNINVTTGYGDVNTGSGTGGFNYILNPAPYYNINTLANGLGGISTASGGNVTITAAGNVISYTPSSGGSDAGTGTFGTAPGNLTVTAGGSVYGHYVLANGVGTITAENGNVGIVPGATGNSFALSLIDGTWFVNAPNGNIYLTEVRNPNALYNNAVPQKHQTAPGQYLFTYAADDAVDLTGLGVYLTDSLLPRLSSELDPVIYPPILDINAGGNGVTLEGDVTLYPSVYQNLEIITTDNGSFTATSGQDTYLLMSDSSLKSWAGSAGGLGFSPTDNGTVLPTEFQPVIVNISGDMGGSDSISPGFNLITSKETDITVGGDLINLGFSGQNLSANDVTSINVAGNIENVSSYASAFDVTIPSIPADDLPLNMANEWFDIFSLAVNSATIAELPANIPASEVLADILAQDSLFSPTVVNDFTYDPNTKELVFSGQMSAQLESELASGITVLHLVNGEPVVNTSTGDYVTDTISWAPATAITTLYNESQGAPPPSPGNNLPGYRIGGPGQFDVTAQSISLGNSYGILSCGVTDPNGGFNRFENLTSLTPSGASINVTVTGPDSSQGSSLNMLESVIAALGGGDVNVTSEQGSMDLGVENLPNEELQAGVGIYTSGGGNVNVTALGDIDIDGSRVGTYNGGDIFIESLEGNVNVGSGSSSVNGVYVSYVDPVTGQATDYAESTFGSGILAFTLVPPPPGSGEFWPPNPAALPGNITVTTPEGSINGGQAGILQLAQDGNVGAGPAITLAAGTPYDDDWTSKQPPLYIGNVEMGGSGVIGGTVNIKATGDITGAIISRQNSTVVAQQSFSGTVLSGGSVSLAAGGSVSGTIVGIGGASVSGGNGVSASVLGQNVSVNGGAAESTLGSSATATSATQSAAQQANSQAQQQVAADQTTQEDNTKKKKPQIRVGRVTVILSAAVPE